MAKEDNEASAELLNSRKPEITETGDLGTIYFHFIDRPFEEVKLGRNEIRADFLRREAV